MPSTISAGTTAGTAIAIAGDTTGNLAFQTNGTTTAMTIDTSQNVGVGTTTPSSYGPNGSMLALAKTASGTETNLSVVNNSTTNFQGAGILLGNIAASADYGATYLYHHKFTTGTTAYAFNISQRRTDGTYIANIYNVDYLNNVHTWYRPNTAASVMSVDGSGNFQMNSGYGSIATAYGCRAWVNFVGSSGAINSSGGVSSVTRNGTGDYSVNFSFTFPDANYAGTGMGRRNSSAQRAVLMVMNNTATYNQFTTYARFYTMLNDSATVEDPIFFNYTAVR